ncbi:hypothetical protein JL722_11223 [Aureococcus anophagefferens]|nr:hypothetical protein JL722_11223 [Aureococcus anophagefferens]
MAPFMAPSTSSAYSAATVTRETRPAPSNDRVVGMMDAAYFVGRRELLDWINTTLELNVQRIEDTCSGAVACQLMDCIQPNTVPMSKVNWGAKDEYAMICNYKLLQSAFDRARVSKPVEVNRLIRGKYQDNLEFMQWFKAFYDGQRPVDGYDPVLARRKPSRTRDFYFKKLQAVEAALRCRPPGDTAAALAKDVYRVLYEASEPDLAALGEAPAPALAPGAAARPSSRRPSRRPSSSPNPSFC